MIAVLVLAAAAGAPTDEADAANLAYTRCLFATSREGHAANLSVGAFEQLLAKACLAEQGSLERTTANVFARRGDRDATAEAIGFAEQARQQVVEDYRQTLELEPQLRTLAQMCRAHPEQCRE